MVVEQAYAKINLSLDVCGRRPNGYHDVRMIMQSIDLHDTVSLDLIDDAVLCDEGGSLGDEDGYHEARIELVMDNEELKGEAASGKDNIITKAAKAFMEYTRISRSVRINLEKRIPIAAGMAGGSTDAAATLRGLNRLFEAGLSDEELEKIGVTIGADVPFCIKGGTKLSEGIGEILTELPSPGKIGVVICKPLINVSTKDVYESFDALTDPYHPDVDLMIEAVKKQDVNEISELLGNSLEGVTKALHPVIGDIEKTMEENGALRAIMSGSGPTVFGVLGDLGDFSAGDTVSEESSSLIKVLKEKYPDAYVGVHYFI